MSKNPDPWPKGRDENPPSSEKPRHLIRSSPLVAGGKARVMSAKKVDPKPAKPRPVSELEAQGYQSKPFRDPPLHEQLSEDALKRIRDATSTIDEPECVGPAILDGYSESARFYDSLRHQAEVEAAQQSRKLLSAEKRLQDAQRRAKQSHVTTLKLEFVVMEDMLSRSRNRGQPDPPSLLRKLEQAESLLDGMGRAA